MSISSSMTKQDTDEEHNKHSNTMQQAKDGGEERDPRGWYTGEAPVTRRESRELRDPLFLEA